MESMVAMIVVTAGVGILTFALMMVAPSDRDAEGLPDPARQVMEAVISDERWTSGPGVLIASELDEIEPNGHYRGARALLQEVGGGAVELFADGEVGEGDRYSCTRAVNIRHGPQEVTAATLTVWVWL